MDSLVANYGSSDEEDAQLQDRKHQGDADYPSDTKSSRPSSSIFSSLPPPKSLSLFHSLPPPKSSLPGSTQTLVTPQFSKPYGQDQEGGDEEQRQRPQENDEDLEVASGPREQSSSPSNFSGLPKPSTLFSSLPEPKISSLFSTLPPPKTGQSDSPTVTKPVGPSSLSSSLPVPKSSSVFSSLPPPKTQQSDSKSTTNLSSSSDPKPKKVVQFRPPINAAFFKSVDVDDDDDDKEENDRKSSKELTQTASVKSFLSSIPAPRNSVALGALSSSGSGRRAIIEADVPASNYNEIGTENEANEASINLKPSRYNEIGTGNEVNEISVNSNSGNYEGQWFEGSYSTYAGGAAVSSEYTVGAGSTDPSYWASTNENLVYHDTYNHGNYTNYGQYDSNRVDGMSITATPDMSGIGGSATLVPGKRGRNDIPQEIIEVKQDELIKDRPREDQVKLTGIAFGPSYQVLN